MSENVNKAAQRRTIIKISLFLMFLTLALILTRQTYLLNDIADLDSIWLVSVNSRFHTNDSKSTISVSPPIDTQHARVVAQQLLHPGLKIQRLNSASNKQNKRLISLSTTQKGLYGLETDFTIHLKQKESEGTTASKLVPATSKVELYLKNDNDLQLDSQVLQQKIRQLSENVSDLKQLSEKIFTYVHKSILINSTATSNDIESVIKTGKASHLMQAKTMVALSRAANIPARLITGFILEEDIDAKPVYWVELLLDDSWTPFDPHKGYKYEIPINYLPVSKGNPDVVRGDNLSKLTTEIEISQIIDRKDYYLKKEKSLLDVINLSRLSLETRQSLAILMLLPLGALFTTLVRNFVGIRTYGTFTPALIGLAARYADWVTALMIFSVVAILGLSGRHFIHGKLLRAPRLSIVFTLVAVAMTLGVSLLEYFNLSTSGHVVLLPIVILTTLVDRIYTTTDDNGIHTAMVRLGWTMAVAIVCLGILQMEWLGHLILQYPESQLLTIALILLTSTYSGGKIINMLPLRWLDEPKSETKRSKSRQSNSED